MTSFKVCGEVCCLSTPPKSTGIKRRLFDKPRQQYGGSFDDVTVNGVLSVLRVLPIFVTIIMYWAVYAQMTTTFLFQGERMDVQMGSIQIPVSALNAFNTIMIIILIPIVDMGLYPFLYRIGRPLSHLHRIGIGFVLASLSVVVAGVVEIARKNVLEKPGGMISQELGGEWFNASTMSVFVQVPQYALVGASEVFASICGLEFAYTQAPKSMQGLLTGLFYVTSGLGNFLSDGILNAVIAASPNYPWFADEINDAHVEYLFFLLAGLMLLDFFIFLVIAHFFRYTGTNSTFEESTEAVVAASEISHVENVASEINHVENIASEVEKNDKIRDITYF